MKQETITILRKYVKHSGEDFAEVKKKYKKLSVENKRKCLAEMAQILSNFLSERRMNGNILHKQRM